MSLPAEPLDALVLNALHRRAQESNVAFGQECKDAGIPIERLMEVAIQDELDKPKRLRIALTADFEKAKNKPAIILPTAGDVQAVRKGRR